MVLFNIKKWTNLVMKVQYGKTNEWILVNVFESLHLNITQVSIVKQMFVQSAFEKLTKYYRLVHISDEIWGSDFR